MPDVEHGVVRFVVPYEQWSTVDRLVREQGFAVTCSSSAAGPVMNVTVRFGTADENEVKRIVQRFAPNTEPLPPVH